MLWYVCKVICLKPRLLLKLQFEPKGSVIASLHPPPLSSVEFRANTYSSSPDGMNAISRALKKGIPIHHLRPTDLVGEAAKTTAPTSPKTRKRGRAAVDGPDPTPVAKQHLSEGGDIDLGMLDQEAFARVIAEQSVPPAEPAKEAEEAEEEVTDDVTYRPSGVPDGADPIWSLRMTCLPVLDIIVRPYW